LLGLEEESAVEHKCTLYQNVPVLTSERAELRRPGSMLLKAEGLNEGTGAKIEKKISFQTPPGAEMHGTPYTYFEPSPVG
jgi:hypothetical protein